MVDFGWSNWLGRAVGGVGGGVWRTGKGRAIVLRLHWRRGEGGQGERDRRWPMTNVHDGWLCGEQCEQRS